MARKRIDLNSYMTEIFLLGRAGTCEKESLRRGHRCPSLGGRKQNATVLCCYFRGDEEIILFSFQGDADAWAWGRGRRYAYPGM